MVSPDGVPAVIPSPCRGNETKTVKTEDIVFILPDSGDGEMVAVQFEEPHMFSPPKAAGYAPFHLGQRLVHLEDIPDPSWEPEPGEGDYEIVRKLGWGQEGSVWLARELETSSEPSFVAIKVLTLRVTQATGRKESFELPALNAIEDGDVDHPGRQHCTLLLDLFLYRSVHGHHFCLVFEPLSVSLYEYVEVVGSGQDYGFPIDGLRNIARQVLLAVSYVHANGFIHTDIKSDNIFIDFGEQNETIAKYLTEHPSRTYPARHEPSISPDPIITVVSEPLPPFGLVHRKDLSLKLGDFGAAIPMDEVSRFPTVMPTALRAPEVILGCPWGWQVDIWMVGCLLFERIDSSGIFHIRRVPLANSMTLTDVHLARMQELLGPFPAAFLDRCSRRDTCFDKSGELLRKLDFTTVPALGNLEQRISKLGGQIPGDEMAALLNFMRRCLTIDPELPVRPSAEELLKDPFLAQ